MLSEVSQRKTSTVWSHSQAQSNEQNEPANKTEPDSDTDNRGTAVMKWGSGLAGKMKGLSKENNTHTQTHRHWPRCGDSQKETRWEEVNRGWRGPHVDGRKLDPGWWTHNSVYRWCITDLHTWNLYFLTNVTSVKSNIFKEMKKRHKNNTFIAEHIY